MRQELEFDRGQSQYDGIGLADVTFDDLDPTRIEEYRARLGAAGDEASVFKARSL